MSTKNIKGITIEIGGNTSKLQDSLKSVNKVIYSTNSELKQLNQALKLDPKNTELLAQKQDVLKKNIQASTEKLNQLKTAQKQMGEYNSLTEDQKKSYRELSVEIAKSESALQNLNKELKGTNSIDLSKIGGALKSIGATAVEVTKKVAAVVAGVSTAIAGVVAKGVKEYAEYEQNLGGVFTLFGTGEASNVEEYAKQVGKSVDDVADEYNKLDEAQERVTVNAFQAYKTANLSANEYMSTVTSFAASLKQSISDPIELAAAADQAVIDMADNANKMGTAMESIQNAYKGFAKQNYTMLDNLKLGYGGTKEEMKRLLADAQKLTGVKYDINNLNDVYKAIHAIQDNLGITGTTAKEASETISGSFASVKSAFTNFLVEPMEGDISELSDSIKTFLKNISNVIKEIAPGIVKGIGNLFKEIAPILAEMISDLLPIVIEAAQGLLQGLIEFLNSDSEQIVQMAVDLLTNLAMFILENLPLLLQASIQILVQLAKGIVENLPTLIPAIVDCILTIVEVLIDNVDLLVDAAIEIIIALTKGIINALPRLIERIPEIIIKIVGKLIELAPKLVVAAIEILVSLGKGLVENIGRLLGYVAEIPGKIIGKLKDGLSSIKDVGKNIIEGIFNGIKQGWENLKDGIKNIGGNIINGFKSVLGIHSPSKVMKEQIGVNLGLGIVEGIEDTQKELNAAMSQLSAGIEASVNPTINPTANSNPLIIQIENFNNNSESDIQRIAQELEFYRHNSALARGEE